MHSRSEDRQILLSRICKALGRTRSALPDKPPPQVSVAVRLASDNGDLVSMFVDRADQIGLIVHRVRSTTVVSRLLVLLQELEAERIGLSTSSLSCQLNLDEALRASGRVVVDWTATSGLEDQFDLDVGITGVEAALAESGTIICCSGPGRSRGLSLVPPCHVALVAESDILPDMIDYWALLYDQKIELPSSIVFITGPSKTADLEGTLVHGVHGPRVVHVLLVEGC